MKIERIALLASTSLALFAAAAPARAQQLTPPAATPAIAEPQAGAMSEDVVVTAQKREQTLIDVPQSISVVSGATLENQQANNFQDYLKDIPGLQLTQATPGFGRLVIRGVNTGGVASTVGVYVDETPFGSSSSLANGAILAGDFDTFDVARIEVLRGPQGTLYGASSLSGVLKFVTNAPETDKLIVRMRGGVEDVKGGDVSYYGNAVVNVPLGDTLAFRASGVYRKDGGFIDIPAETVKNLLGGALTTTPRSNINGSKTYGGRAALLFTPTSNFSVKLSAVLQNIEADAPSLVDADPHTLRTLNGGPTQTQFVPQHSTVSYRVYNGLIDYDFGFATLTSSSSYATLKQAFQTDATFNLSGYLGVVFGIPNNLYLDQTTSVDRFSQELRLAGKSDLFDWLVGGYYTHEKGTIAQRYVPVTPGTTNPIASFPLLAQVNLSSRYEEVAGFADGTLHLGPRVDIDGGVRYSHNDQRADQVQSGVLASGPPIPSQSSSEGVFTYSVAPKFKLGDRLSIYARVAKGFRPGGPNVIAPPASGTGIPAGTPTSFSSDTLTSYEGGIKGETRDRSFSFDLASYHIDWSRIQLFAVVNGFGLTINGVSAVSDGGEFTVTARPTPGLELSANGAYTDAHLTGDTSALVGGRNGDQLPFTPKYSVSINADYRWAVSGTTNAFVGASERFLSKQSGAFDNTYRTTYGRQRQVPSYNVVDLRAGLDFGRFGLELYARNILDTDGKVSTSATTANGLPVLPGGAIPAGIIRPRSLGAALTASF